MHRMQRNAAGSEPVGNFAHMLLAVGVIQMLARAKNLDGLRAAAHQFVQQARMQPLFHVNVSGDCLQHKYRSVRARIAGEVTLGADF